MIGLGPDWLYPSHPKEHVSSCATKGNREAAVGRVSYAVDAAVMPSAGVARQV